MLKQILALMDEADITFEELRDCRGKCRKDLAAEWLKNEHNPGCFLTDDGYSSASFPVASDCFGIWLTDTVIFCSEVMRREASLAEAEAFIRGKKLGPFFFRLPNGGEQLLIAEHSKTINASLSLAGLPALPEAYYWVNKKVHSAAENVYVNHTVRHQVDCLNRAAKALGIFIINLE